MLGLYLRPKTASSQHHPLRFRSGSRRLRLAPAPRRRERWAAWSAARLALIFCTEQKHFPNQVPFGVLLRN
jgi:hypothetical protein